MNKNIYRLIALSFFVLVFSFYFVPNNVDAAEEIINSPTDTIITMDNKIYNIKANTRRMTRILTSSDGGKYRIIDAQVAGNRVAYLEGKTGSYSLWVAGIDGSARRNITKYKGSVNSFTWGQGSNPKYLYYSAHGNLYKINIYGSNVKQLTYGPAIDTVPKFSPYIVGFADYMLAFNRSNPGNKEVMTLNLKSNQLKNVSNNAAADEITDQGQPWISRTDLAFESNRNGQYEIYRAKLDGSRLKRLTNTPLQDERWPIVKDGLIAYKRGAVGVSWSFNVHAMSTLGQYKATPSKVTLGYKMPFNSANGDTLLFRSQSQRSLAMIVQIAKYSRTNQKFNTQLFFYGNYDEYLHSIR